MSSSQDADAAHLFESKESISPGAQLLAPAAEYDPGSFRDRSARVYRSGGQIFRALDQTGLDDWNQLSQKPFFQKAVSDGDVVATHRVDEATDLTASIPTGSLGNSRWVATLHHQQIPVITYPYEWSFGMLRDAARLTLRLQEQALRNDMILKDASPYNVQFQGARPVFIDTSSFTRLRCGQAWEGYRQFCQQFLYPLMLQAYHNVDFQPLLRGRLNGITPQQMSGQMSLRDFWRRGVLSHVCLHARIDRADTSRSASSMQPGVARSLAESGFQKTAILNNVRGLMRIIEGLRWKVRESRWASYDALSAPVHIDGDAKEAHLRRIVGQNHWGHVWDLGCNLGRYARIVAPHAETVLALDSDHLTVDRLYQDLVSGKVANIIPLVFNLADPSPGLGWNRAERQSLEMRRRPDLILCLAVIHHLVIGENLLLEDVVRWLRDRNASVVIEFVDRNDPQVRSLLENRVDQCPDYCRENFISLINRYFPGHQSWDLPSGTRTIFYLQCA